MAIKNEGQGLGSPSYLPLKFCRTQSYFDRSASLRYFIGFVFALCLFLFLHFRQTYVEIFELGSTAKRFFITQIDFSFPDDEATIILRQQAAAEIGPIYKIPDEEIFLKGTEFQQYITQDKQGAKQWEQIIKKNGFDKLAVTLGLLTDQLQQIRFTDARTLSTIEKLGRKDLKIPLSSYYVFIPPKDVAYELPLSFWSFFGKKFLSQNTPPEIAEFILNYFEDVRWNFSLDDKSVASLKRMAKSRIPQKMTKVHAGERIIDQGETITARHLAMMQAMKEAIKKRRNLFDPTTILGSLLMTLLFLLVIVVYLYRFQKDIYYSNRKLALITTIFLLDFLFAKVFEIALLRNTTNLVDMIRFPLFVPFAALLLSSLTTVRMAAFAAVYLSIIFSMALSVQSIPFLVINLFAGMVVILNTHLIKRRKEVFIICGKAWLLSLLAILAFHLYENTTLQFSFLSDISSTFIFMGLTAILVVGLLPMLETLFQIMTDMTLMEFMDPSHELMRRLTIEAPGTYQHSLVVGNLSEAAASAIGANGLFCRVATLYHDIGKLANPQYFTENQLSGVDMHQLLTPQESAQVIIAHIPEGVALARKSNLPEQFIDIIKEHHGTTLVYYFYHKQLELAEDKNKVSKQNFRYGGPKPHSKESTIIMIADTLEAASRCLDTYGEESIKNLVESLVSQKAEDGQFDESLLTFEELKIVKQTMIKGLLAATHARIKYPRHNPGEEG